MIELERMLLRGALCTDDVVADTKINTQWAKIFIIESSLILVRLRIRSRIESTDFPIGQHRPWYSGQGPTNTRFYTKYGG